MSMQDPLADMLARIKNAQQAGHESLVLPSSKLKKTVLEVLKDEGYIEEYSVESGVKEQIKITLKYYNGKPVIEELTRCSRPGLRKYTGSQDIPQINGGLGVAIISTSKGLMTDRAARRASIGGEVLCSVF